MDAVEVVPSPQGTLPDTVEEVPTMPAPPLLDEASLPQPLAILRKPFGPGDIESAEETVFYILGTAHVSKKSCEDTATLIRTIRPELVFVELCPERQPILTMRPSKSELPLTSVLAEIRSGRTSAFQGIYGWLLARVGSGVEVAPGEEFRVAVYEAQGIGAAVVLGDRPLSITLARLWGALGLWEKARLLGTLLWTGLAALDAQAMRAEIERLKESDVLTEAIKEVGKEFPSLLEPLIYERDRYMAHVLRTLAAAGQARRVVAVVGAGHLEGIKGAWEGEIAIEELCRVPPKRRGASLLRSTAILVGVAATGAVVAFGVARWRRGR